MKKCKFRISVKDQMRQEMNRIEKRQKTKLRLKKLKFFFIEILKNTILKNKNCTLGIIK